MTSESSTVKRRRAAGWTAVGVSALSSAFWAFWGSIEAFHEGWISREWTTNVLGALAYLAPMLALMIPAVASLLWRRVGAALHVVAAALVTWRFELYDSPAVLAILGVPLCAVVPLYLYGQARPRRWALRAVAGIPLATAVLSGAYPCWIAVTRHDDGNYGLRIIEGNGVRVAWAPQGPGWSEHTANWDEARSACANLSRDGLGLEFVPPRIWRLPTVEEAVGSAVRRGRNAGGAWDARSMRPTYRVQPNKETPLWSRYSPAIYRWTATEADTLRAYRIVWNGFVNPLPKTVRIHFRCVADPPSVAPIPERFPRGDRQAGR